MRAILKLIVVAVATLIISASCEHKELCTNHNEHAARHHLYILPIFEQEWEYHLGKNSIDWSAVWDANKYLMSYDDLRPEVPSGVRILALNKETAVQTSSNILASGGVAYSTGVDNSLLFYNNDTEYIVFNDMGNQTAATATTRTRTRSTYMGNEFSSEENENTVAPPDMLYARYLPEYAIERQYDPDTLPVTLMPLVYTYLIRYEVTYGIQYFGIARGALSGMAGSVYLHSGHTSEQVVTVIYDCEPIENYGAQAFVRSFGIPNYPNDAYSRGDQRYALNIEIRLRNGRMVNYDFDVTDQVERQPHGGVIEVSGIEIPDSIGQNTGSGFDIEVEGWGEYVDVDLPL